MKVKLKIYLAGYSKDIEYRNYVKNNYGNENKLEFVDPMTITFSEVYDKIGRELSDIYIVRRDKKLISQCDILIANIEFLPQGQMMIGTIMEIEYAFSIGIPVFVISSEKEIRENPWIKFHTRKSFDSIKKCLDYIVNFENI